MIATCPQSLKDHPWAGMWHISPTLFLQALPQMYQAEELSLTSTITPCTLIWLLTPAADPRTLSENWHELQVGWLGRTCVKSAGGYLLSWDVMNTYIIPKLSTQKGCDTIYYNLPVAGRRRIGFGTFQEY